MSNSGRTQRMRGRRRGWKHCQSAQTFSLQNGHALGGFAKTVSSRYPIIHLSSSLTKSGLNSCSTAVVVSPASFWNQSSPQLLNQARSKKPASHKPGHRYSKIQGQPRRSRCNHQPGLDDVSVNPDNGNSLSSPMAQVTSAQRIQRAVSDSWQRRRTTTQMCDSTLTAIYIDIAYASWCGEQRMHHALSQVNKLNNTLGSSD